jgi:hypothetical protein
MAQKLEQKECSPVHVARRQREAVAAMQAPIEPNLARVSASLRVSLPTQVLCEAAIDAGHALLCALGSSRINSSVVKHNAPKQVAVKWIRTKAGRCSRRMMAEL